MADGETGIIFTQSGVPVKGSADYQHVYDSRWKFMEKEIDTEVTVTLPAAPSTDKFYQEKITALRHELGFLPFFECDFTDTYDNNPMVEVYSDKTRIFLRRGIGAGGAPERTLTIKLRIYNLPVLEDYVAPKGLPQGTSTARSNAGVKFLDRDTRGVDIGDDSPVGFSVDSTKKILSIHRHGLAKINDYVGRQASATAIDTATNIITFTAGSMFGNPDTTWIKKVGAPISWFPNDYTTYPGGIVQTQTVYAIPIDDTHMRVAASYENALNAIPIDLTSTGSLPATLNMTFMPGGNEEKILHDVGYPPTYLLALVDSDTGYLTDDSELYIGPAVYNYVTMVRADDKYLSFAGVQAIASNWLGYVILKDPAEIAR